MTPEVPELEVGSFGGAPIFSAPGLMGGYPAPVPTVYVVRDTDLKACIDGQEPLPNHEGDPVHPEMLSLLRGKVEVVRGGNYNSRPIAPYSLYALPGGDGSGFGDVLQREPALIRRDVMNKVSSIRNAEHVYGVILNEKSEVDEDATRDRRKRKHPT